MKAYHKGNMTLTGPIRLSKDPRRKAKSPNRKIDRMSTGGSVLNGQQPGMMQICLDAE
jgi:hypothetical protein